MIHTGLLKTIGGRYNMNYKEYREKWGSFSKKFKQEKVPIHLDLELTTYCNLACAFCPRTQLGLRLEHMDLLLAKKIIKEFAEKGGCSIKFVYLGEPLMYPHLTEVIQYAKEQGIIDTIIATNGNLLTYYNAQKLIECGLDFIIFSIDSYKPKHYEALRKKGNLSNVIKGVVYLDLLRGEKKKPKIQIQAIPISPYNDMEIYLGDYEQFWKPFADKIRISPYCEDYENLSDLEKTPHFFCQSPFRRFTVRVDGDIALCCGSRLDSKIIGNYNDMNLEEAWNSTYMKTIRKNLKEGNAHLNEPCRVCPFRKH